MFLSNRIRNERDLATAALALADGSYPTAAEQALGRGGQGFFDDIWLRDIRQAIRAGQDPLGEIFLALRPVTERRQRGAIYTPALIADAMIGWARVAGEFDRVLDPGAGSGRFLIAAAQKFPAAELIAVESDPLAALILRANITQLGLTHRTRIHIQDFLLGDVQPTRGRTLFIGNPPYVRHHDISQTAKLWFGKAATRLGIKASKLAGLHVHFFLRTMELARTGDYGCFITAAEWLDVNYGSAIRKALLDGLGGQALYVLSPEIAAFPEAMTTAAIVCFKPREWPTAIQVNAIGSLSELANVQGGRKVSRGELVRTSRWSLLIRPGPKPPRDYVELGELFRVHRGQVTGANNVWIASARTPNLPDTVLFPAVTRAAEIIYSAGELTDSSQLRKVIDLPVDLSEIDAEWIPAVKRFLTWARTEGADQSYIARHRPAWHSVGLYEPAPVLATYMGRRPPAFALNRCCARHLNISHGLYPRERIASNTVRALVTWLNSNVGLDQGRTYAGGLVKFEPGELERVLIPPLTMLH
ncbi:MAG: methyltransferase [Deltaproteobacteria bacterium]|nr:methyltransferase [Deltaproteobacteria bacterium]